MDQERDDEMLLQHYIDIGVVCLEGVDEDGEFIFSISEKAKELAPELWEAHINYIDESLVELYKNGLAEVEYDENLEATFHLSKEGYALAKKMGLVEIDMPDAPNE